MSYSPKVEKAIKDVVDQQIKDYPKAETDAEKHYDDLVRWTDLNQFQVFDEDGKEVEL